VLTGKAMQTPVSPALFDQFARGWRGYLIVALIALASGLMGIASVSVMDVDEARFAQASRQMADSGDYVRIRLLDEERNRKPVGAYWVQAASTHLFEPLAQRDNAIWTYRVPSVLGLVIAALATLWGGTVLVGQRAALFGAGLLAAGVLAGFEAMTAKADALLLGFTTLALAALARLFTRADQSVFGATWRTRAEAMTFWAALACAVLVKGPVAPALCALALVAIAIWERRAGWMKPLLWWPGPALAIAMIAPWFTSISYATDGRFLHDMLLFDLGAKLVGADHAHIAPPGFHLALLPILIFPATYALPAAARMAWTALRARRDDDAHTGVRFLIAWIAPALLILELIPSKLVHYALPLYPAIALLCGLGLTNMRGKRGRTAHPVGVAVFAVVGALMAGLLAFSATLMPGDLSADTRRALSAGMIGAVAIACAVAALLLNRRPVVRAGALIACALVLSFSLRERLLPESRTLFPSQELVAALTRERLMPNDERQLWTIGYNEVSLAFLTRPNIEAAEPSEAAIHARDGDTIVVEGRLVDQLQTELAARGREARLHPEPVRGFNLGGGDSVALYFGVVSAATGDVLEPNP
jgi:4-amino-4-deoxy-L-arabinose transferase-like glycosyltransferase